MSRAIVEFFKNVSQETLNEMLINAVAETNDIGLIDKLEVAGRIARRVWEEVNGDACL
jgi:hypothetical protein